MALRGGSVTLLAGGRWLYGVVGACIQLPEVRTCSEKESLGKCRTWMRGSRDSSLMHAAADDPGRCQASSSPRDHYFCPRQDWKTHLTLPPGQHRARSTSVLPAAGGGRTVHTSACLHSLSSRQKKLRTVEGARNWVASLSRSERNNLELALHEDRPTEGVGR